MKTNAIIRIVLFSLAILILLGILFSVIIFDLFRFDTNVTVDRIDPVEEQIDTRNVTPDIRNFEIDWVAGSITFQKDPYATDISVLELSPVDSKYKMVLKQSGQTLKIKYSDQDTVNFPFGINVDISKDLIITVPENWSCNSLEIDSASAEVILNDLSIQKFDFDGASGVCKMLNCSIGELDIDTASGDVQFSGTLETLDCDAVSSDCNIEVFNVPRSMKIDGLSGDLDLILPPDAGFTCNLDSLSGNFDTDFSYIMHGDAYFCGNGDCKIKVSAMSGSVSILKGIEHGTVTDYADPSHDHNFHH